MLVIGGGATGLQVAAIFSAFGSRVQLFEKGPRILSTEDDDVAAAVAAGLRDAGIAVNEDFGTVDSFLLWRLTGGTSATGAIHATAPKRRLPSWRPAGSRTPQGSTWPPRAWLPMTGDL